MASGGSSPEEIFTGPWDPYSEGADPFDLERGDEETLFLIEVDIEAKGQGDVNPFAKGPWYDPSFNPILQEAWTPSLDPLVAREKNTDKFNVDTSLFDVPITPSSVFQEHATPVFVSGMPEVTTEPSHRNPGNKSPLSIANQESIPSPHFNSKTALHKDIKDKYV